MKMGSGDVEEVEETESRITAFLRLLLADPSCPPDMIRWVAYAFVKQIVSKRPLAVLPVNKEEVDLLSTPSLLINGITFQINSLHPNP